MPWIRYVCFLKYKRIYTYFLGGMLYRELPEFELYGSNVVDVSDTGEGVIPGDAEAS